MKQKPIKEQFEEAINGYNMVGESVNKPVNRCIEISDQQAIEFAKWIYKELVALPKGGLIANTHEELLGIFKRVHYKV